MGNLGGMEVVVILLVALIVLGPAKLPDAARQLGKALTEVRRVSSGFQRELREAIQDPMLEADARERGAAAAKKKTEVAEAEPQPMTDSEPDEPEPTHDAPTDAEPSNTAPTDDASKDD